MTSTDGDDSDEVSLGLHDSDVSLCKEDFTATNHLQTRTPIAFSATDVFKGTNGAE
jgi:hypothetical protein